MAANIEHLKALVEIMAKKFTLQAEQIHAQIYALKVPGLNKEVCRLMLLEEQEILGITFHVEMTPTDAIQVWSFAQTMCQDLTKVAIEVPEGAEPQYMTDDLRLLMSFYETKDKQVFSGPDAEIMAEQEKQNRIIQAVTKKEDKRVQEAEWQHQQDVRNGKKPTFH